jgi:5-formyltetrahydrofolate cyclo-ligase
MPTETEELKRALRRDIRQRRLTRTAEQRDAAAADFTRNLIALTTQQQARVVAC